MSDPIDYGRYDDGRGLNYWTVDRVLQDAVRRTYPEDAVEFGQRRLNSFGDALGHTVADNADLIDDHGPELATYDRHGNLVNEVEYHPAQAENERVAYCEHGIVADAFRAPAGRGEPMPLLHNLAMGYLLSYADTGFYCPVAMTTGVALVLDLFGDECEVDVGPFLDGLTARDHDDLVEGAMFLTEKGGGSDVGGATETVARREDGTYRLYGEKWFCSNLDAGAKLVLARRPKAPEGMGGISLFLVPHEVDGEPNDLVCRRLKDKLGTTSVPTGEVELDGAVGYLVGEPEEGFRYMAEMVNLERLSNAFGACGVMGRALLEAKIHAENREAFGGPLAEKPLMRRDLVEMAVDHEAATRFTFAAGRAFSERHATGDDERYRLMRALVPVAKYRTGRLAVDTTSYAMEVLGGNGYVNDFVTHRLLRDAQVLPIWEGASNVLALDLLRALDREDAHEPLLAAVQERLDAVDHPVLADAADVVRGEYADLGSAMASLATGDRDDAQYQAKELADYVYEVFTAALLLEVAQERLAAGDAREALVAREFVDRHLRDRDARGIPAGDRPGDEHFDAIVRFGSVAPGELADAAGAAADD